MHSEDFLDSILCVSGSRLIQSGLDNTTYCTVAENEVVFVNAGGEDIMGEGITKMGVQKDLFFQGGDVLRTDEVIMNGGAVPSLYQSARFGSDLCYKFENLSAGEYVVDLHFSEIVNTNGPKGMRVFNVFVQEEKVISELDIYSIVGANAALQIVDVRVSVEEDGVMIVRFEGIVGSPIVNGICVKKAAILPKYAEKQEYLVCNNCQSQIKISLAENKALRMKSIAKYEQKIEELKAQCNAKADECYEAWMSLTSANQQLENIRMEHDNKFFENMCLGRAMEEQTTKMRDLASRYEREKRLWASTIDELERKIKMMKVEHSKLSHDAHECIKAIPELSKMISGVQTIVSQYDSLKLKFNEEQVKRKMLYNQLQEAKGNIRVFCRCRPLTKEEASDGHQEVVDFIAAKDGDLGILTSGSKRTFKFDRVYTPKDDQVDVFADAAPLAISVLDGYNVCIFAYGQTGTGKTFTMEGTEHNRGVNYRTLQQLFKTAEERKESISYNISVSVLEVYNEQIRDLLATSHTAKRLEIKKVTDGVHHVPGIVEAKVKNMKEVWDVLQAGSNARAVGSNNVNEHSSRSHCILLTMVRAKNLITCECTMSKLWLVDLAGSERLAKTEAQGERLKEAQNINRSLSALGDVISALAAKSSHIPYRNSKLTHLLQDSLGGDSKTLMFVQISPSEHDLGETLSSLNFATRVRGVELGPAKKQMDVVELQKVKIMLDKAKQELKIKEDAIRKVEDSFQSLEGKAKGKDQLFKNQQAKVNELESQLALKMELCGQLEKQVSQLLDGMKRKEQMCSSFELKVNELESQLKEYKETESMNLQYKVKELEKRMKEKTKEFELHTRILQEKLKEAENKLTWERDNGESRLLQQKVKILEEKLRQHEELVEHAPTLCSSEKSESTPLSSRMGTICNIDPPNQRYLNPCNRMLLNQGSSLLKGADSLRELRRKRAIENRGTENNFLLSTSLREKKTCSADQSSKARPRDPCRALARFTKGTKPMIVQRASSNTSTRSNKDLLGSGGKESHNKFKNWLR